MWKAGDVGQSGCHAGSISGLINRSVPTDGERNRWWWQMSCLELAIVAEHACSHDEETAIRHFCSTTYGLRNLVLR
jgi:hypothetical protein